MVLGDPSVGDFGHFVIGILDAFDGDLLDQAADTKDFGGDLSMNATDHMIITRNESDAYELHCVDKATFDAEYQEDNEAKALRCATRRGLPLSAKDFILWSYMRGAIVPS